MREYNYGLSKNGKDTSRHQNSVLYHQSPRASQSMFSMLIIRVFWEGHLHEEHKLPETDLEEYGWKKESLTKTLASVTLPDNIPLAPHYDMIVMRCECYSDLAFTKRRTCNDDLNPPRTLLCKCFSSGYSRSAL